MPHHKLTKDERKEFRAAAKMKRKLKRLAKQSKKLKDLRKRLDALTRTVEEQMRKSKHWHQFTMRSIVLPKVAGVIYNEIYRIGMGRVEEDTRSGHRRAAILSTSEQYLADFAMQSVTGIGQFALTVSTC